MQRYLTFSLAVLTAGILIPFSARADGVVVDKIYHPYVDALEREVEYRGLFLSEQPALIPAQLHKLAFGASISDRLFAEVYLLGSQPKHSSFNADSYELELKWQLTEQGEYSADWGVVFEFGHKFNRDIHEFSTNLISEKEFGRFSGTANLRLIEEWGDDVNNEFETALGLQARYRYTQAFEPGVELYLGQTSSGLGPVLQGTLSLANRKKLHWESGLIVGLNKKSAENTLRVQLEYEF